MHRGRCCLRLGFQVMSSMQLHVCNSCHGMPLPTCAVSNGAEQTPCTYLSRTCGNMLKSKPLEMVAVLSCTMFVYIVQYVVQPSPADAPSAPVANWPPQWHRLLCHWSSSHHATNPAVPPATVYCCPWPASSEGILRGRGSLQAVRGRAMELTMMTMWMASLWSGCTPCASPANTWEALLQPSLCSSTRDKNQFSLQSEADSSYWHK